MSGHGHSTKPCEWCKGYQEQTAWLQGKSISDAQLALDARLATATAKPYNDGGNVATRDYIERTMTEAIRTAAAGPS